MMHQNVCETTRFENFCQIEQCDCDTNQYELSIKERKRKFCGFMKFRAQSTSGSIFPLQSIFLLEFSQDSIIFVKGGLRFFARCAPHVAEIVRIPGISKL